MTSYNQEFCSRLITDGFTYFFWQHESIGGTLNFRVSAYSRDRLIGEEIRYLSSAEPLLFLDSVVFFL